MRAAGWKAAFPGNPLGFFFHAVLLALVVDCHQSQAGPPGEQPAATVTTVRPERKTLRYTMQQPGVVEAAELTKLYAKLSGYVQKVQVDIGDRVKKGQVLAELAVPELEAEHKQKAALVVQAEAEVEQARRALQAADATVAGAKAQVQEAEAGLQRARAHHTLRKAEYERLEKLEHNKAIAKEVLDEKLQQLEAVKAALAEAEAKVKAAEAAREASAAKREMTQAGVKVAQARLEAARAEVQRVESVLQYAKLRAPFDGVVVWRAVDVGALTGTVGDRKAEPLLAVARIDSVRVVVALPERDATLFRPGAPAVIRLDARNGQEVKGKLTRTAAALDRDSRTLRVEIDLPNHEGKLLPGMYGVVSLTVSRAGVWTLPEAAVVTQDGQTFCYHVEGGKAVRTPVQVGLTADGLVEVLKKQVRSAKPGLEGDWEDFTGEEEIVVSGLGKLKDGQAVRIVRPQELKEKEAPKPTEGTAGLAALVRARRDAVEKAYQMAVKAYGQGERQGTEPVYLWSRRWLDAERDLSGQKEGQAAALEAHLKRMNELHRRVKNLHEVGMALPLDVAAVEFYRAEAEFWLAQQKAK